MQWLKMSSDNNRTSNYLSQNLIGKNQAWIKASKMADKNISRPNSLIDLVPVSQKSRERFGAESQFSDCNLLVLKS